MNDQIPVPGESDFSRELPHDLRTERWLLGALMHGRQAWDGVCDLLEPEDFYLPAHQMIYTAGVSLWAQQIPVDPVTLRAELAARKHITRCGGEDYLLTLMHDGTAVVSSAAPRYAEIIRELAGRRKAITLLTQATQRAWTDSEDLTDIADFVLGGLNRAGMTAAAAAASSPEPLSAFRRRFSDRQPPVIPGLLDHMDRVIIVGFEGDGKSTLGYQAGFCGSAGIHPFAFEPIPPIRVAIIDLENPPHLMRRKADRMEELAHRHGQWDESRMLLWALPAGVDLTKPRDKFRLTEGIRRAEPDLILAGPIRKMVKNRGQNSEELHSQVTDYWDMIREQFGAAVWLEHHAPKGGGPGGRELVPYGSMVYMAWPEFGFGLRRSKPPGTLRFERFRGDREEGRPWPEKITRNAVGGWPWVASYPAGTFTLPLDGAA